MVALIPPSTNTGPAIGRNGTVYTPDAFGLISVPAASGDVVAFLNAGWTVPLSGVSARNNFVATTDPGVTNDISQDFAPGSIWFNLSNNRQWMCQSNAVGAAVWYLDGVVVGVGAEPSGMITQFGGGTGTFAEEGNLNRQISSTGVSAGATGVDSVLAAFSIPAGSFDAVGRGICFSAQGSFAANGNTKRVKIIFNPASAVVGSTVGASGTTIADSAPVITSGGGWALSANVFKYGAAGSNTQIGLHQQAQLGAAVAALLAPSLISAVESGAILVAITGNCTTSATDVVFNFFEANAMN